MVNGHTATGIAQAIFYAPITLYAQYIGVRCWKHGSKAACYMIMTFTMIRLAGGVLLIEVQQDSNAKNVSMIKAAYILLNIGVVPLITAFEGILSNISHEVSSGNKILRVAHIVCASLLLLATGLLIGAGSMTGKEGSTSVQSALYKVGYFDLLGVFIFCVLLSLAVHHTDQHIARNAHLKMTKLLLLASPFLAVRVVYGFLGIFEATGAKMFSSMWSSLFGSSTALALMCLIPEYVVVCIYLYILQYKVRTSQEAIRLSHGDRRDLIPDGHELRGYRESRSSHAGMHHK